MHVLIFFICVNMLVSVLWNICYCIKNTLRERWFFQCQQAEFSRKNAIFLNKILWKIAGKAVFDNLNCKILFVSQPWWPTGFLGIYQLTVWNLKWPPKSGIVWSQWPLWFKMLFPALYKSHIFSVLLRLTWENSKDW